MFDLIYKQPADHINTAGYSVTGSVVDDCILTINITEISNKTVSMNDACKLIFNKLVNYS